MDHVCRAARLIQIMQALKERCYSTEELAERFGVSPRTIRKDLLDIQGEPLYFPVISRYVWQEIKMTSARRDL